MLNTWNVIGSHVLMIGQLLVNIALIFKRYLSVRHLWNFDTLNKLHSNYKRPLSKQLRHALLGYFSGQPTLMNDVIITSALPWWLLQHSFGLFIHWRILALHVLPILRINKGEMLAKIHWSINWIQQKNPCKRTPLNGEQPLYNRHLFKFQIKLPILVYIKTLE